MMDGKFGVGATNEQQIREERMEEEGILVD